MTDDTKAGNGGGKEPEIMGYSLSQIRDMDKWMKSNNLAWKVINEDRAEIAKNYFRMGFEHAIDLLKGQLEERKK